MARTETLCYAMLSLATGACKGSEDAFDTASIALPDGVHVSPQKTCEAPVADRLTALTEQRDERGLDVALNPHPGGHIVNFNGGVVMEDLDGDGDLDIAFAHDAGSPIVYANDGRGNFEEQPTENYDFGARDGTAPATHGAADIDGDGLLDLIQAGQGRFWWSRALGGLRYAEPEVLWAQQQGRTHIGTIAMGDMDGDGDLDLLLPGLEDMGAGGEGGGGQGGGSGAGGPDGQGPSGSPDILLRNDGGGVLTEVGLLFPGAGDQGGVNITAAFTDREGDGDVDLLVLPDLGQVLGELPPGAFWRNDGTDGAHPYQTDDAADLGFDLRMSAMGLTNGDWNDDGLLDYCISDVGPTRCMVSQADGGWADAGRAMGAVSLTVDDPGGWSHWGVDIEDLDNDGWPELVAAGALPPAVRPAWAPILTPSCRVSPARADCPGSWTSAAKSASRPSPTTTVRPSATSTGMARSTSCSSPPRNEVRLWSAGCTDDAWLAVRLVGPPGNPTGVGTRIRVVAGNRTWTREAMHIRAMGQGPTQMHVGLGDISEVDVIEVTWPGGLTVDIPAVSARRIVTVEHPDATR